MVKCLRILLIVVFPLQLAATIKDSTINYNLPDSVKAVQFMSVISIKNIVGKKESYAGIKTDVVSLSLQTGKEEKEIEFEFPDNAVLVVSGIGTTFEKGEIEFACNWTTNEEYKLMIAVAVDSAENFSLYSGYVFLPKENKWKLIGTCKITGRWTTLQNPSVYYSSGKKAGVSIDIGQVWVQRSNGSWKNMTMVNPSEKVNPAPPVVNLFGHTDSVQQRINDIRQIEEALTAGKTDAAKKENGIYYIMMKEGSGRQVSVEDTVVVFYKGYLLEDGKIFDQTKDKPATFPLKRLIRGWQIGVPLCKVGGKIKLVIPSDLAYSIRTRAAKIPPNSILVFEIEVVDSKPAL